MCYLLVSHTLGSALLSLPQILSRGCRISDGNVMFVVQRRNAVRFRRASGSTVRDPSPAATGPRSLRESPGLAVPVRPLSSAVFESSLASARTRSVPGGSRRHGVGVDTRGVASVTVLVREECLPQCQYRHDTDPGQNGRASYRRETSGQSSRRRRFVGRVGPFVEGVPDCFPKQPLGKLGLTPGSGRFLEFLDYSHERVLRGRPARRCRSWRPVAVDNLPVPAIRRLPREPSSFRKPPAETPVDRRTG